MTNEEAIKELNDSKRYVPYTVIDPLGALWNDAIELAVEALEKQIPKKPEEYWDGYSDGYPVIEYQCPCCGRDVDDTDHHCVCGQTIDWSEEE